MTAYMVAEMKVTDPAAYEQYKAAAADVIAQYGGRYVARGGRTAVLEGDPAHRIVIVAFDTVAAAERWYRSPEYQAAKALRTGACIGRLYAVEGLGPQPDHAG
jgi:uncharacterized protein (DUF1330 family)